MGARLGDVTIRDDLVIRNAFLDMPMAKYAGEVAVENGVDRRSRTNGRCEVTSDGPRRRRAGNLPKSLFRSRSPARRKGKPP